MRRNPNLPTDPLTPEEFRAPASARWIVGSVVMLLLFGAAYLIGMRYEALLADLATMTAWCF